MTASPAWIPLSTQYRVRLTRPPDRTASGLYLPESLETVSTEATVISHGQSGDNQAMTGERVLFEYHTFQPFGDGTEGMLRDEDLAAVEIPEDPWVEPVGEWLLIETQPPAAERESGIAIPHRYRKQQRCGVILNTGIGAVRTKGSLAGTRQDVCAIMGVKDSPVGGTAYWDKNATLLLLSCPHPYLLLVRATEIIAVEEPNRA